MVFGSAHRYSEEAARAIDAEVAALVKEATQRARAVLAANVDALHDVAQALIEQDTLTSMDLERLVSSPAVVAGSPSARGSVT